MLHQENGSFFFNSLRMFGWQMVKLWGDFTCWAFCGVKGLTIIAQGDCAEFREKNLVWISQELYLRRHTSVRMLTSLPSRSWKDLAEQNLKKKKLIGVNIVKFYVYSKLSLILWEKINNGLHLVFHFSFFLFIIPSSVLKWPRFYVMCMCLLHK